MAPLTSMQTVSYDIVGVFLSPKRLFLSTTFTLSGFLCKLFTLFNPHHFLMNEAFS